MKPETPSISKQEEIDNFIKKTLKEFTSYNFKDDNLWEAYQDEFSDKTLDDFQAASRTALRSLRTYLSSHGVWVKWDRHTTMAVSLFNTLSEESPTEWTKEDIINSNETFDSVKIINVMKNSQNYSVQTKLGNPRMSTQELPKRSQSIHPSTDQASQKKPSEPSSYPITGYGRELSNLAKMYGPELKYQGEGDSFDYKLNIFMELCEKADVPELLYAKAYSIMLSGSALTHYFSVTSNGHRSNFDELCTATRDYFEGPETKRNKIARWESLTLRLVITENVDKGKSTLECLQMLFTELRHLQLSFDKEYRSEKHLHTKLINACRSFPACQLACFKPSSTLMGLFNDLQSSISTVELNESAQTSQLFTDRRYYKENNQRNPETSRSNSHWRSRKSLGSSQKRCYVCKRPGCWSRNHTVSEQESAKKVFQKQMMNRINDCTDQLLAQYEGDPENLSTSKSELDNQIEMLVLDTTPPAEIDKPDVPYNESFITSFGTILNPRETALNLADLSFQYAITGNDPTNPAIVTDDDPFSYLVSSRYNSSCFYGIIIDTGASKYSTV